MSPKSSVSMSCASRFLSDVKPPPNCTLSLKAPTRHTSPLRSRATNSRAAVRTSGTVPVMLALVSSRTTTLIGRMVVSKNVTGCRRLSSSTSKSASVRSSTIRFSPSVTVDGSVTTCVLAVNVGRSAAWATPATHKSATPAQARWMSRLWTMSRLGLPNPYLCQTFEKRPSLLTDCKRPGRSVQKTIGMVFRHGTPPTRRSRESGIVVRV